MAAIDFPLSPTNGQVFTSGDKTWSYSTTIGAWSLQSQTASGPSGPSGPQGITDIMTSSLTAAIIVMDIGA